MNTTKHTPGPWHTHRDDTAPLFPRFYVTCKGIRSIAIMTGGSDSSLADENEANARLIAAAPELLEALQKLQPILWNDSAICRAYADVEKLVEAAIAKAKGTT